jgi:nitrous oxidase accessory protein NosD
MQTPPMRGNYWADYNGTDANHDGVGDTPYVIDATNSDNYPLLTPVNIAGEIIPAINK